MPTESTNQLSSQQEFFDFFAAKPFLKWAGGKRQLLPRMIKQVPSNFGTYREPFLGGGALFFALAPKHAVLSDLNAQLIRTYRGVKSDVETVIGLLRKMPNRKAYFDNQRKRILDDASDVEVAAWLIYLNRTAFNGLYRVNRRGEFNVPFGNYSNPRICDAKNLRAVARRLQNVELRIGDFKSTTEDVQPGDFVYFDPPYVPVSQYSDFTRYTAERFGVNEQVQLRDYAKELKDRGVQIMVSNSDTPLVHDLYGLNFEIHPVTATRKISAKPSSRGQTKEVILI